MGIFWWNVVILIYRISIINARDMSGAEYMIHKTVYNLKPRHVIVFMDRTVMKVTGKYSNFFFRGLASEIPTTVIDLIEMKNARDNRSLKMPIFRNPRSSSIYMLLQNEGSENLDFKQISNILDNLVTISPIATRPKCLLVFYSDTEWSKLEVKRIMQYAWSLKFLDLSIIKIETTNRVASLNYNPFSETYSASYLETVPDVFPDKLINVNAYPLKLPIFHAPPFVIIRNKSNEKIEIAGRVYIHIETVCKKLNFQLPVMVKTYNNFTSILQNSFMELENNDIDLIPIPFLINAFLHGKKLILSDHYSNSHMATVARIIPISKIHYSSGILIYIFSFPLVIISLFILMYLIKFRLKEWGMLHIFQILVGISIRQPRQIRERIIFFTMVILSMNYSTILFSKLTNIKLMYDERHIHTLEDIYKSKMSVFTIHSATDYDDVGIKRLFSSSIKVQNNEECINIVIKTNNAICIIPFTAAKYYARNYLNDNGMPVVKVAKLSFGFDYATVPYGKASPYVEKFDKIIQYIFESGMPFVWKYPAIKRRAQIHEMYQTLSIIGDCLSEELVIILSVGYSLSILVFMHELISTRFKFNCVFRKTCAEKVTRFDLSNYK